MHQFPTRIGLKSPKSNTCPKNKIHTNLSESISIYDKPSRCYGFSPFFAAKIGKLFRAFAIEVFKALTYLNKHLHYFFHFLEHCVFQDSILFLCVNIFGCFILWKHYFTSGKFLTYLWIEENSIAFDFSLVCG